MPGDEGFAEPVDAGYELLDAGAGRRLERFGARVVDRPAPGASGPRAANLLTWRRAHLRFEPRTGWFGAAAQGEAEDGDPEAVDPWPVTIEGLTLELRPTASGGLGIYPEHAANLAWVAERVEQRPATTPEPPQVLNLFAHTGLISLAAARAGATVVHVDASKGAVDWARRNAALSGLADSPIRWLVDDALGFVSREARRGRRYNGIVLDPPSFGRAGRRQWRLAGELPALLEGCAAIAAEDAFVLLTAHTTGFEGELLGRLVDAAFPDGGTSEGVPLTLRATSGASLELGWAIRRTR